MRDNARMETTFTASKAYGYDGWYVIEHRHDGDVYVSTGEPRRVVAGPYTTHAQAMAEAARRASVREVDA